MQSQSVMTDDDLYTLQKSHPGHPATANEVMSYDV
jgi:hypothetical protein